MYAAGAHRLPTVIAVLTGISCTELEGLSLPHLLLPLEPLAPHEELDLEQQLLELEVRAQPPHVPAALEHAAEADSAQGSNQASRGLALSKSTSMLCGTRALLLTCWHCRAGGWWPRP